MVRDLRGKVRICVPDTVETDESGRDVLQRLADRLHHALGAHAYSTDDTVLFLDSAMLDSLQDDARQLRPGVFWVDRQVTGRSWWTVGGPHRGTGPRRYTLFSVKGGVGRSTTAVMLAWRLAHQGERVLVVDLDLESPGLSSAMLAPDNQPEFGITDWFAEDLVGQAASLTERMTVAPSWAHVLEGDVRVAPAHGSEPGEYLAKLGRVYMDTGVPWTNRLEHLLSQLEEVCESSVVLLESRSGLHDIAAATVTDMDAQVLLFTIDSASHWTDYRILFGHWQNHDLATSIRERLSIVSALTPDLDTEPYLQTAVDLRSYRRLRVKVFLRSDQIDESRIGDCPDASKVLSSTVELNWPRHELYGLLWHCLANGRIGEVFRGFFQTGDWPSMTVAEKHVFSVPRPLIVKEEHQREKFHALAGRWMGTDRRRGFPYTWIPNHLADTDGRVSPRSFLAALRTAADDTADRHSGHETALHYDSIKLGVQEASRIRVRELQEDYPWVHRVLSPLGGMVVPCDFGEIARRWTREGVLDRLAEETEQNEVKLPPLRIDRGAEGVREDLESLRVFMHMRDGRVNIPDVFRVGYGLGRRGGVRPVQ